MKRHFAVTIHLLILMLAAAMPAVLAQSLPASMANTSSLLALNMAADNGQKLMVAGNSLALDRRPGFDLSEIPSSPDSVSGNAGISSTTTKTETNAAIISTSKSKLLRGGMLLALLAIAYLATRKRTHPPMMADSSELQNFPKKPLAQR